MQIKLRDLRAISEKLFLHFEAIGIKSFEIPAEYYWNIVKDEAYDPYRKPTQLTLGQLSDDWAELEKVLQSDEEILGFHLVWLAAVCRAIGEFNVSLR